MFDNRPNTSEEACEHAAVTKHEHRVIVTHTMGPTVMNEVVLAGSKAHAAFQVGMILLAQLMQDGQDMEISMHNVLDHLVVDVELIV